MFVSVILTVLNEGESLRAVLESLTAQTRLPDEVVISDGGSRDNTLAILREYADQRRLPLNIVEAPGANISAGRNVAIRAAQGDIIAVTDAGVRCEPTWLENLLAPFARPEVNTVAGFFCPDATTVFEIAMGATVLPEAQEINPHTYLPSSRSVAFRKSVWEAVGGYPAWLDFGEDVVFDLAVRARYGPFEFVPSALVHFRPRSTWRAFFRQYYFYARGDGKANLFPRLHAIRYFTYWVAAPLLVYAALTVSGWLWVVGGLAGLAYIRTPLRRLWPKLNALPLIARAQAVGYVPLIRLVGDVAKMLGYPAGVWWRWQKRSSTNGHEF